MMMDNKNEPVITYSFTLQRYLTRIWNSRIGCPNEDLLFMDDEVKELSDTKYHPYIVSAFSFQILDVLYVPIGGTFG